MLGLAVKAGELKKVGYTGAYWSEDFQVDGVHITKDGDNTLCGRPVWKVEDGMPERFKDVWDTKYIECDDCVRKFREERGYKTWEVQI
jgi:hypothetical protein